MADRESSFGLQEVEPSPVEETPSNSKDNYFPDNAAPDPQRASRLGLSQHSPVWYLSWIQKYSSYAFTAFGIAHITNTSIIPLITRSVPESERYLLLTRPYYQGLPAEPLLIIIPVCAHVASGLAIRFYRRNMNAKRYGDSEGKGKKSFFSAQFWPRVSGISMLGFQFIPALLGHTFTNRVIPNWFPGGSSNINLSFASHAFAKHPVIALAGFSMVLTVACFHMTWGWAKWLGFTPDQATGPDRRLVKERRWLIVNGIATVVTALWMAGSFGVVGRAGEASGWVGRQYDAMYRKIPLVGRYT